MFKRIINEDAYQKCRLFKHCFRCVKINAVESSLSDINTRRQRYNSRVQCLQFEGIRIRLNTRTSNATIVMLSSIANFQPR